MQRFRWLRDGRLLLHGRWRYRRWLRPVPEKPGRGGRGSGQQQRDQPFDLSVVQSTRPLPGTL
jgi:hypothetical protein